MNRPHLRKRLRTYRDKVVVVTGAGSGMGRAYALDLAGRGAHLALQDVDAADLAETLALLPEGTRVTSQAYDVSDRAATYAFADLVRRELGPAHVVINNAGVEGSVKPVWATTPEQVEKVMAVNFYGVVHGTQAFLPQLLANGQGAVVNVSSIFGLRGTPNHADYSASKFAVRGFTEALSAELVTSPITVHLVHPGGIATRIARNEGSQAFAGQYFKTQPEDIVKVVLDRVLKGRRRIVHGHNAGPVWLGSRLLPMRAMDRLLWRDMKRVIDRSDYPAKEHAR